MKKSVVHRSKLLRWVVFICLIAGVSYGLGCLYFRITGGFRIAHISSDFAFNARWSTRPLTAEESDKTPQILKQRFTYLGKGCQSYVFLSQDGEYVLKFFKYQRFRPQFFLYWFTFIPTIQEYLTHKIEEKRIKRERFFESWVTAFNDVPEQTGLLYVHLNKTDDLHQQTLIVDKIGMEHLLNMDEMEFLIQKKATMLTSEIDELMAQGKTEHAKRLLTDLVEMMVKEYKSGIADHDYALMQNTAVYRGQPMHIDVGQFEKNLRFADPVFYHQELYNRTWKFRNWLRSAHPELLKHLEMLLKEEMGDRFYTLQYIPKEH